MPSARTIKFEYSSALPIVGLDSGTTFNEGAFKSTLKRLNPSSPEECSKLRELIISEMRSNLSAPSSSISLVLINNSVAMFKIAFEYHIPQTKMAVTGNQADAFFTLILEPILPRILSYWTHYLLSYCHLGAEELLDVADSAATSSHHLICLIHRAIRTLLSLLKRMLDAAHAFLPLQCHLQQLHQSFLGLLNLPNLELPLDIKCNLGLGICYILKLDDRNPILDIVRTTFSIVDGNPVNHLAFAFGFLNICSTNPTLDPSFESRMVQIGQFLFKIDHGSKEALNLGTARVLELWMEKLVQSEIVPTSALISLFPDIEFFVFSYIPGHIDAVKSCCRNILKNLTKVYDRMEAADVWTEIRNLLERILVKPEHVKWIALWCVTVTTRKSLALLDINLKTPQALLSSTRTMKNPASEVYLTLMGHHLPEVTSEDFETTWILPLFSTQKQMSPNETNWPQKRSIIGSILKTGDPKIVKLVMDFVVRKMGDAATESSCTESTLLAVEAIKLATELKIDIKTIHSEDGHEADNDNYFRGLVPRQILHSWATSSRMQIRLACFSLLIETKRSTEVISVADLESLKILLKYNIVSQNAAFRQQFFAYYKRLIKRFRDSMNLLQRTKDEPNLKNYEKFFLWLWNFLTKDEGLFPGANFGRRCQSLEFISELLDKFDVGTLKIPLPTNEDVYFLRWIFDTYEYNKKLVFPILLKLYKRSLEDENLGNKILEASFHLCESVHPPDSVTGRYLALFLIQHRYNGTAWMSVSTLLETVLNRLVSIKESIQKTSLIETASKTQMYGYLRLIRSLFTDDSSISSSQNIETYRPVAVQILNLCLEINQLLLPVLGDAAPEGFLPGLPDSDPGNSQVVRSINAQRLLVCSWRSMRDICMLLTEMVDAFPVEGEKVPFVLTFEEVEIIGDHLLFLLKNVMHRGVFEQVFTGFKHLAYRLFKSTCGKLNELPVKWLNDAFDQELISTKCITRRSAGLPFIFQALLSPMCLNEPFITKYVDRIFETYKKAAAEGDSGYVRIHCTNVLRGLFKDSNFSRVMMPYVPKGLKLVFDQLKSDNWNECNAGLMLYGSIIRRTFGPELNLMTAPTFFRRFPEMYEFLLEQVKRCAEGVTFDLTQPQFKPADDFTYQVLLLLSSFAVNGVVEYGPLKISEFVSPIRTCAGSSDYQVREVAAKALKPFLIQTCSKVDLILSILEDYVQRPLKKKANSMHGDFLQILQILKSLPEEEPKDKIVEAFNTTFTTESPLWSCPCPTVYESLAEICLHVGQPLNTVHNNLQHFYALTFDPLRVRGQGPGGEVHSSSFPGLANADVVMAQAQVKFALHDTNHQAIIYEWLQCKPWGFLVQLFSVLCSKNYLNCDSACRTVEPEVLVIFDAAIQRCLSAEFDYVAQTVEEEAVLEFLASRHESIFEAWSKVSGNSVTAKNLFDKVLKICQSEIGTMECKARALVVLGKLAFQSQILLNSNDTEALCEILSTLCDSSCDVDLRLAVATALPSLPFIQIQNFTVLEQCKVWYAALTLMFDDEGTVRNELNSKLGEDPEVTERWVSETGKSRFCERKSCELIVRTFLTEFGTKFILEALVVIVALILRDDYEVPVAGTEDCEEEHLFDRSEMNAYAEPLLLAKVLCQQLASLPDIDAPFRRHFETTPLTPDLITLFHLVANVNDPQRLVFSDSDPQRFSSDSASPTLKNLARKSLSPSSDSSPSPHSSLRNLAERTEVQTHIFEFLCSFLKC